jgi:MoaA/NifB/PqqE/SkfB family radical SAM enzyme
MSIRIIKQTEFGDLKYHQNYTGDFSWPSNDYVCLSPYINTEIRINGNVTVCCPSWNPLVVGNVLEQDLRTIWKGDKIQAIRKSVLNGSYTFCDQHNCPHIQKHKLALGPVQPKLQMKEEWTAVSETPRHIHFVMDLSCNLSCPSCRTRRINTITDPEIKEALKVTRSVLDSVFAEPHNEYKMLGMDGSGEVFHSEVWREIFNTHPAFTQIEKWPGLQFEFNTNGTMLTPKYQEKYSHLLDRAKMVRISVDAGNKNSYELVRREGDWDQLWINLRALHNRIKPTKTKWCWNLIIQKNNYRSIPEFVKLASSFDKRPAIMYTNILDWGQMGDSFQNHAVWRPDHPEYPELQRILNLPEVKYYRC